MELHPYADNFIPVLRPGYPVIHPHTPERPFCPDPACPCKEDKEAVAKVNQLYMDGLITQQEATDIVMGRMSV